VHQEEDEEGRKRKHMCMKKEERKEIHEGSRKIQERGGVIPRPPLSYYKRKVWALDHP
jgi:hypothetical protein